MSESARRPFCSDAARARGDENAATVARIDVWIAVELPVNWGAEPLRDAPMPAAVRDALRNVRHSIPRSRVVFIRKRVGTAEACHLYVARSTSPSRLTVRALESIEELAHVRFDALLEAAQTPARPVVLVCTHGQHDSCCGRRGYPLFDALQKREEIDVWQCSHIGGDRFAPNAVVLPWGLYFGPLDPPDADGFVDALLRDEIVTDAFRGRSTLSRPAQAAEVFLRRSKRIAGRDALRVLGRDDLPDGRVLVRVREKTTDVVHEVTVEQFVAASDVYTTCTAQESGPIREFRVVDYRESKMLTL